MALTLFNCIPSTPECKYNKNDQYCYHDISIKSIVFEDIKMSSDIPDAV